MNRTGWDAGTLTWAKAYDSSRLEMNCLSICLYRKAILARRIFWGCLRQLDENISAASIDDVFHFRTMKVRRRTLAFRIENEFFSVGFRCRCTSKESIPQRKKCAADLLECERARASAFIAYTLLCDQLSLPLRENGVSNLSICANCSASERGTPAYLEIRYSARHNAG